MYCDHHCSVSDYWLMEKQSFWQFKLSKYRNTLANLKSGKSSASFDVMMAKDWFVNHFFAYYKIQDMTIRRFSFSVALLRHPWAW